ncbi:MAG TPA: mannuronan 5-epimerase AlgG [Verrucomicrobiae bacterium]|nr:mannuronan 5-epimerase AlgG [Verrucomicrobiae bacterium]
MAAATTALIAAASARAEETAVQVANAKPATQAVALQPAATPPKYVVREADGSSLFLEPPAVPDLRPYTDDAIKAKIPKGGKPTVAVRRIVEAPTLHEFTGGSGRLGEWAGRQNAHPIALFIEGGTMTAAQLAKAVETKSHFEDLGEGVYIARLPVVVMPGAALHLGSEVKELRLSEERGAFLVNDGLMFIVETRITGWRESANGPATFKEALAFRPFIISWGGAELYIARSTLTSLGYEASKSFGVSISQYSPNMDARLKRKRPTGWIINSEFKDIYYGFYCYEADDVVVLNNTYRESIIYGIDPHDRSNRLIIAHNTVADTKKKHGIIISRAVNDSWLLWNKSVRNKLSGMVIDRNSVRNIIAYNDLFENGTDGLTIYESPKNLVWNNRSNSNARHGIRMRNSVDVRLYGNNAVANGLSGIYGHIRDLSGTDRDIKLDPFEQNISMVVVGGQLIFNGSGPLAIDQPLSLELYGVDLLAPTKKVGIQLTGVLGEYQQQILDIMVRRRGAVIIEPAHKQGRDAAPRTESEPASKESGGGTDPDDDDGH